MEKRFYRVDEISQYLGFKINTIRKWIRCGEIPFCRINGGIRFDIKEIERWIEKGHEFPAV